MDETAQIFMSHLINHHFFEQYWEKQATILEATPELKEIFDLKNLLSVDEILESLLNADNGNLKYVRKGVFFNYENPFVAYLSGASIIVNQMDRYCTSLFHFCQSLTNHYFLHVFAVLYLTPPNSYAVKSHSDDQDVFLVQLWGSKHWKVYKPLYPLSYTEEMVGKDSEITQELGDPILEQTLHPGSILYLPRGFIHKAHTSNELSLHVTVTLPTSDQTWGLYMEKSLRSAILQSKLSNTHEMLLRSACLQSHLQNPKETHNIPELDFNNIKEQLTKAIEEVKSTLTLNYIREIADMEAQKTRQHQKKQFEQILTHRKKPLLLWNSVIHLRQGVECNCDNKKVVFKKDGMTLQLSIFPSAVPLINKISTGNRFAIKDLPCDDFFERICLCYVFLFKDVLELEK